MCKDKDYQNCPTCFWERWDSQTYNENVKDWGEEYVREILSQLQEAEEENPKPNPQGQ
jgi:Lon protease-like protein